MSRQLPVPVRDQTQDRALSAQQSSASSSLARLAISLAPDILRATERIVLKRDQPAARSQQRQGMHGHSIQMSEVDIDTTIPFVRRITVRNASSWSTFPLHQPEPIVESKHSNLKLLGLSSAAALIAAVMVRRAIPGGRVIDVQGRQRD